MTSLAGVAVTRRFGGLTAVDAVDIEVHSGEVVALIGPNGAGKTTLFACLSGSERVDSGRILLDGQDVTGFSAGARARRHVGRTFQRLEVFASMSVGENLRIGAEGRRPVALARGLLGLRDRSAADDVRRVDEVAELLGLTQLRDRVAGSLPTGTQRLVELGRALCHDPHVLLLDEPASGLDTAETGELRDVLRRLAVGGMAVLLVEHDIGLVLDAADRIYAMASGQVLASGTPSEVQADPAVRAAYLTRSAT